MSCTVEADGQIVLPLGDIVDHELSPLVDDVAGRPDQLLDREIGRADDQLSGDRVQELEKQHVELLVVGQRAPGQVDPQDVVACVYPVGQHLDGGVKGDGKGASQQGQRRAVRLLHDLDGHLSRVARERYPAQQRGHIHPVGARLEGRRQR